jgi:hypothetical protein
MYRTALLIVLAACATDRPAQKPQPTSRGLRADQHREAARDHARRADELARWPEARRNDTGRFDDPNTGLWYRAWDQSQDHQRLAAIHSSAAAQLQAAFDEACVNVDPEHMRVSPLQRHGLGGMATDTGVVIFLPLDAGPPDRLLLELRCHRAWMMLDHSSGMEMCPLDLPKLRIQARGDATGISVELTVEDPVLVPELQRRAAHELEIATRQHTTTTKR